MGAVSLPCFYSGKQRRVLGFDLRKRILEVAELRETRGERIDFVWLDAVPPFFGEGNFPLPEIAHVKDVTGDVLKAVVAGGQDPARFRRRIERAHIDVADILFRRTQPAGAL